MTRDLISPFEPYQDALRTALETQMPAARGWVWSHSIQYGKGTTTFHLTDRTSRTTRALDVVVPNLPLTRYLERYVAQQVAPMIARVVRGGQLPECERFDSAPRVVIPVF